MHIFGNGYDIWSNSHIKTKFWGKSLEFTPLGLMHMTTKKYDDYFIAQRPQTSLNNIIMGTMYIDHYGDASVKNTKTGEKSDIKFQRRGWGNKGAQEIKGHIYNSDGEKVYQIWGKWTEGLYMRKVTEPDSEPIVLFKKASPPEDHQNQYYFSKLSIQLNDLPDSLR
jgi:hypothetical protein